MMNASTPSWHGSYSGQARGLWSLLDPRTRILSLATFCIIVGLFRQEVSLAGAFLLAIAATMAAGWNLREFLVRAASINVAILPILVSVAFAGYDSPPITLGPLKLSGTTLRMCVQLLLKINALVLFTTACLWGLDEIRMGHALAHLRIPRKLAWIMILAYRYLGVIYREYHTLRGAMKVRCFRPQLNAHTLRSFGYLVAMVVIRSFHRSERILAAMKCRGFRGEFPLLWHFRFSRYDFIFAMCFCMALLVLAAMEWGPPITEVSPLKHAGVR